MARIERFRISHTRKLDSAYRYVTEAAEAGVILNTGTFAGGRDVRVDGVTLKNFGSCSYMALERMPELRDAAHAALDEYGTQFHFSRAYVQCSLYQELDALLEQLTGRPVVVAASTSLAHMAALPVLVRDGDQIVIDQFAHASLHTAVQLLPGVPLEVMRHNRMDILDEFLTKRRSQAGKVWYVCDGLYSMLGDFAPIADLKALLDRHDDLRLYIDDAHATSWVGRNGRGVALDHFEHDERVVVALSLNKAFSAAGGVLALPNRELVARIRRCGGPMLFSGPIQPPMLGAAVGSAKLHLSPGFADLQADLAGRLDLCVSALGDTMLDVTAARSPIFQVRCDSPRVAFAIAEQMKERGFYCCVCVFPAVPMNRPGLRFTVTRHNQPEDIVSFLSALNDSASDALAEVMRTGHTHSMVVEKDPGAAESVA
ncbi:MAG TPA: aminotransferase class I/II-fold pyridoxal phosphate-dependent enzyme [Polyangiaceae bacterium]|jgi:7-keto-8-aminopelargonate synthetase-like enzyme|nr:aminotransferase class I/II-fold pyridoxal phosphate-dependent enzyme [Polyangiaceae bacterium]